MTIKKFAVAGWLVAALMLPSLGALAQETPAAPTDGAAAPAAPADGAAAPAAPAAGAAPAPGTPTGPVDASDVAKANEMAAATVAADTKAEDNWLKICGPVADGKEACIMRQMVVIDNQFFGQFELKDDPSQESRLLAAASVPLGVLLPFGLTWQIDGGKQVRVPYMLCNQQMCTATLVINEAYVSSLKKGGKLTLLAKNRRNEDLVVPINLAGFTSAYDGAATMTADEFNQARTGQSGLEKQLQDKAEDLRKQLNSGTTPPADGAATPAPTTP